MILLSLAIGAGILYYGLTIVGTLKRGSSVVSTDDKAAKIRKVISLIVNCLQR